MRALDRFAERVTAEAEASVTLSGPGTAVVREILQLAPALVAAARALPGCIDAIDRLLGDTDSDVLSYEAKAMREAVLRERALEAKLAEVFDSVQKCPGCGEVCLTCASTEQKAKGEDDER